MRTPHVLYVALMLGLCVNLHGVSSQSRISILVINSITPSPNLIYHAQTAPFGSLFGAMLRLQESNNSFNFTFTDNVDYGPFLASVNGLAGSSTNSTFWQLFSNATGTLTELQVGMGCYFPSANDRIILKYTSFAPSANNTSESRQRMASTPISILVTNSIMPGPNQSYSASAAPNGSLFGAMTRLQASNAQFMFTFTPHNDFGPFLQSVNGLPGSTQNETFWKLLGNATGVVTALRVGMGCYVPVADEQVTLQYASFGMGHNTTTESGAASVKRLGQSVPSLVVFLVAVSVKLL